MSFYGLYRLARTLNHAAKVSTPRPVKQPKPPRVPVDPLARDRMRTLARMRTAEVKEKAAMRALFDLILVATDPDVKTGLKERFAKHELRLKILQAQIAALSIPTVFP